MSVQARVPAIRRGRGTASRGDAARHRMATHNGPAGSEDDAPGARERRPRPRPRGTTSGAFAVESSGRESRAGRTSPFGVRPTIMTHSKNLMSTIEEIDSKIRSILVGALGVADD